MLKKDSLVGTTEEASFDTVKRTVKGTPYRELMERMDALTADAQEAKRRCDELVERLPFIADLDHDSVTVHLHVNGSMQGYYCALVVTTGEAEVPEQIHIVSFRSSFQCFTRSSEQDKPPRLYVGKYRDISKWGDPSGSSRGGDQFDPVDISDFDNVVINMDGDRENTSERWDLVDDPVQKCRVTGLAMYGAVHQMMRPDPIGYLTLDPMDYPEEMIPLVASLQGQSE